MPDAQKLATLIAEFQSLDRTRDGARMRGILEEAIPEVERAVSPKKWAALHSYLGQLREGVDPRGAVEAYRKALEVWTPAEDHDSWVVCHSGAGMALFALQPLRPDEHDEAIVHLEAAEPDQPFLAGALALLYRLRSRGDPLENWRKRVGQLRLAQSQIARELEPVKWAKVENEIALAVAEQPDADFIGVMRERMKHHQAALEALAGDRGTEYVEACVHMSEAYLFGEVENREVRARSAEEYARSALLAACERGDPVSQARSRLAVARALVVGQGDAIQTEKMEEAIDHLNRAVAVLRVAGRRDLEANALALRATARAQRVHAGDKTEIDALVQDSEEAIASLDPQQHRSQVQTILQLEGEALLEADQPQRAAGCLERALEAARVALAHATTPEGLRQRIWEFGDSSAQLSHCYLRMGRSDDALQVLEDGKDRFWSAQGKPLTWKGVKPFMPPGGALLFAQFSRDPGAVVVVGPSGSTVVWLARFGRRALLEMQRGSAEAGRLGGWLRDYAFRNSEPENWRHAIDAAGEKLYQEIWAPVIAALPGVGVRPGAELLWFPQGGIGVFPMHAAWCASGGKRRWLADEYAIRHAPSIKALAAAASRTAHGSNAVLVVNPGEDLPFAEVESAWTQRQIAAHEYRVLRGAGATKPAVLGTLEDVRTIHFASHAVFDWERPAESYLRLAGSDRLKLDELLPQLRGSGLDLVVLSACETAVARVTATPDEFLGFPAAFLHGGARTVVATLWPVSDAATALLMRRFYAELQNAHATTAEAMRRAQMWLRVATTHEVLRLLGELRDEPDPVGGLVAQLRVKLRGTDPDTCPFAAPFYWAAFVVVGH